MADNVLQKVLEKCRKALLGGTPIIYIKTDSDVFIRKLITYETKPLMVLLSNGRSKEGENKINKMRPVYEITDIKDRYLKNCKNYENCAPQQDPSNGQYQKLSKVFSKRTGDTHEFVEEIYGPCLWAFKLPERSSHSQKSVTEYEEACHDLEKYITAHEDPTHAQYDLLQSSVVIVYSSQVDIPSWMKSYIEFIDLEYPDEEEIRNLIKAESFGDPNLTENDEYLSKLCTAFQGFTVEEITMTMKKIMATVTLANSKEVEAMIRERKQQKMQGGILEQCKLDGGIGGMKKFREWLESQADPLKNANAYMRKLGTPPPKGVLLCGIPGCGKSEAAKFTARTLNLPLLKMDMGSLMDKFVGGSEQRMRDALAMAEAMSPCVLWIDELEKGFSGAGSNGDSSSFKRMFGYMLGWMQDNQKPCFIFATANDIGGLPKEFFRSGRFDALYAVYLPTTAECISIFQSCMKKAVKNIARVRHLKESEVNIFSDSCASEQLFHGIINNTLVRSDGRPRIVVGSDIQKIVNMALRTLQNEESISGEMWERAVTNVINDSNFCTYGDGEENIDNIAIGYCRMLRKGFLPTSDYVLFSGKDYHIENYEQYARLKRISTVSMTEGELAKHKKSLEECEILQKNDCEFKDEYDRAVYQYLRPRINEMALSVEKHEREAMFR